MAPIRIAAPAGIHLGFWRPPRRLLLLAAFTSDFGALLTVFCFWPHSPRLAAAPSPIVCFLAALTSGTCAAQLGEHQGSFNLDANGLKTIPIKVPPRGCSQ